ncbi:MAG: hypothetical protein ABIJ61_08185 [bacterium]
MQISHLIYGTFPDLPGSQQIVYKSEGVDSSVENRLLRFYNEFGDCKNEEFKSSLSVLWVTTESGERHATITKVTQQGKDFSGRWGALLRHSAVLTEPEFCSLLYDPREIAARLVGSGTSEELAASQDLELDPAPDHAARFRSLTDLDWSAYADNLRKLIAGKRLALYSEINTDLTDNYLVELVSLLPLSCRRCLNWSSFMFAASSEFALSLAHSSRYEAPTSMPLQLQELGESELATLDYADQYAVEYVEMLESALAENATARIEQLICDLL